MHLTGASVDTKSGPWAAPTDSTSAPSPGDAPGRVPRRRFRVGLHERLKLLGVILGEPPAIRVSADFSIDIGEE